MHPLRSRRRSMRSRSSLVNRLNKEPQKQSSSTLIRNRQPQPNSIASSEVLLHRSSYSERGNEREGSARMQTRAATEETTILEYPAHATHTVGNLRLDEAWTVPDWDDRPHPSDADPHRGSWLYYGTDSVFSSRTWYFSGDAPDLYALLRDNDLLNDTDIRVYGGNAYFRLYNRNYEEGHANLIYAGNGVIVDRYFRFPLNFTNEDYLDGPGGDRDWEKIECRRMFKTIRQMHDEDSSNWSDSGPISS